MLFYLIEVLLETLGIEGSQYKLLRRSYYTSMYEYIVHDPSTVSIIYKRHQCADPNIAEQCPLQLRYRIAVGRNPGL